MNNPNKTLRELRLGRLCFLLLLLLVSLCMIPHRRSIRQLLNKAVGVTKNRKTVADRLDMYGPMARQRWKPRFHKHNLEYPPIRLVLVGVKDTGILEIWASHNGKAYSHVHTFPIFAASGNLGPKLKEGDYQVPEGIYQIESLNPNSAYHLSLRLNYPNRYDLERAEKDGRTNPGTDIMIHGKASSVGCLAMGDEAIEDIFVLVADTGLSNVEVILAPVDFREEEEVSLIQYSLPEWAPALYERIRTAMAKLNDDKNIR